MVFYLKSDKPINDCFQGFRARKFVDSKFMVWVFAPRMWLIIDHPSTSWHASHHHNSESALPHFLCPPCDCEVPETVVIFRFNYPNPPNWLSIIETIRVGNHFHNDTICGCIVASHLGETAHLLWTNRICSATKSPTHEGTILFPTVSWLLGPVYNYHKARRMLYFCLIMKVFEVVGTPDGEPSEPHVIKFQPHSLVESGKVSCTSLA